MRAILGIFVLLWSITGFTQYDHLLHKPYKEKVMGVHAMYQDLIDIGDSVQRAKKAEEIKIFARKHKDRGLELEVDLFQVFWNCFYQNQPKSVSFAQLEELLDAVSRENIDFLRARTLRAFAEFYWKLEKNYELAFEQYLLLDKELLHVNPEDYPEMARDFMQIGEAYYFFQDYSEAKKYFKKAIDIPENEFNTMVMNAARNTLGLCYQKEKKYDSSDYYFNQVVETRFAEPQKAWGRIARGNIGANYYYRKEYEKAIPLVELDFEGAELLGDYGASAGASVLLADIYMERGALEKSWKYIEKTKENIWKSGQEERLRFLYPVMSKWHARKGNAHLSQLYLDSTIRAINSYHENFNAMKVLRARQKINRQEKELLAAEREVERQKEANRQNIFIVLVLGLCLVIVLGYYVQKRRRLQVELEKQKVENELLYARGELKMVIQKANKQNEIAERMSVELDKLKESEERKLLENTIVELRSATILTDDDWLNFRQHFGKIYPAFISDLKAKYPSLTEAEVRYLMLTKLQLSHKEMAQMLGISPGGVRVTWNRVRKKMGGTLEDTPHTLVATLE